MKINLLNFDRAGLEAFFAARGEKAFRATQLLKWMHQRNVNDFSQMTNLSKSLRMQLEDIAVVDVPKVINRQASDDGTRKWLLQLADGNAIETVFIPEGDRGTLCVSSQVGCTLNCSFCATGHQGYNRNLSTAEIIAQLWVANRELGFQAGGDRVISNVVMMGMGEPLMNFDNVIAAMRIMLDDFAYGLSKRRITLSTAGVVPALQRLRECCDVSLAVSLHATQDALRDELVPINRKYPIAVLLDACREYVAHASRRRITFEYVMLAGVNDSDEDARRLVALLSDLPSKVNLIPFNPFPGSHYRSSSRTVINRFRDIIIAGGIVTVTRKTRGDDIDAACGQLAGKIRDKTRRRERLLAQTIMIDSADVAVKDPAQHTMRRA